MNHVSTAIILAAIAVGSTACGDSPSSPSRHLGAERRL